MLSALYNHSSHLKSTRDNFVALIPPLLNFILDESRNWIYLVDVSNLKVFHYNDKGYTDEQDI